MDKRSTLRLTYHGIHLDDGVQMCYYPHFHHNQSVAVDAEIVTFTVNGESIAYTCSCDSQKWITLSIGGDQELTMTLEKEMTESARVQRIRHAVAVSTPPSSSRSPSSTWRSPPSGPPTTETPTTPFTTPSPSIPRHSPFLSSPATPHSSAQQGSLRLWPFRAAASPSPTPRSARCPSCSSPPPQSSTHCP